MVPWGTSNSSPSLIEFVHQMGYSIACIPVLAQIGIFVVEMLSDAWFQSIMRARMDTAVEQMHGIEVLRGSDKHPAILP
jgi:hypothetical protein